MKQFNWKVTMIVITLPICLNASGYDFEVNGIFYRYNASDQTAYVTYGTEKYSALQRIRPFVLMIISTKRT